MYCGAADFMYCGALDLYSSYKRETAQRGYQTMHHLTDRLLSPAQLQAITYYIAQTDR